MRRILVVLLLVAMALPAVAVGQDEAETGGMTMGAERTPDDPRLYQPGKLTVATGEPAYPPWMLNDDPASGEGFENGLVYAIAAEMGFDTDDVVWVRQTFDQGIAPGEKPYDFNIQQYSVTEARDEFVDFSIVYYQPQKALVALPDSGFSEAQTFADLRSARWGAMIGSTDLDYIETKIGVDDVAVYDDQAAVFQALLAEQIDATVISLPTALFATAVQVPEATIAAVLPPDMNDLGHGLVFEEGSPIVPWVNDALEAIIARGVVDRLADTYLIGDDSIPEITE